MFTGTAERHSVCALSDAAVSLCSGTSNYATALAGRARVPPAVGARSWACTWGTHTTHSKGLRSVASGRLCPTTLSCPADTCSGNTKPSPQPARPVRCGVSTHHGEALGSACPAGEGQKLHASSVVQGRVTGGLSSPSLGEETPVQESLAWGGSSGGKRRGWW